MLYLKSNWAKSLHLVLLATALVVVTARAEDGPNNTQGCCDVVKTDCQGCRLLPAPVLGQQGWGKFPANPYSRCGNTGTSPDGCKEQYRPCFEAAPVVNDLKIYRDANCTDLFAISGDTVVNAYQCGGNTGGENPCLGGEQ